MASTYEKGQGFRNQDFGHGLGRGERLRPIGLGIINIDCPRISAGKASSSSSMTSTEFEAYLATGNDLEFIFLRETNVY